MGGSVSEKGIQYGKQVSRFTLSFNPILCTGAGSSRDALPDPRPRGDLHRALAA